MLNNIELDQVHVYEGHHFNFKTQNVSDHETVVKISYLVEEKEEVEDKITSMQPVQEVKERQVVKEGVPQFAEAKAKLDGAGKIVVANDKPVMEAPEPIMEKYIHETVKAVELSRVREVTTFRAVEIAQFSIYAYLTPMQINQSVENFFLTDKKLNAAIAKQVK